VARFTILDNAAGCPIPVVIRLVTPERLSQTDWTMDLTKTSDSRYLGLYHAGELLGVAEVVKDNGFLFLRRVRTKDQHRFGAPNRRYSGIGRALVAATVAMAFREKCDGYVSTVSSTAAVGFYEHIGFDIGSRLRRNLISDKLDSFIAAHEGRYGTLKD
jgi:GNAT superfamily N-acetyltransferase